MNQPVNIMCTPQKHKAAWNYLVILFAILFLANPKAFSSIANDDIKSQYYVHKLIDHNASKIISYGNTTIYVSSPSCHERIHVSLGLDGLAIITPNEMMIAGNIANAVVMINGVLTDTLDCSFVGDVVQIRIVDTITNQSCWGEALVEDKLPPSIECDTAYFYCNLDPQNPNLITAPDTVYDNCGSFTLTSNDGLFTELQCDPMSVYTGRFIRTWTVTDGQGMTASCEQVVLFKRIPLDSLDLPVNDTMYCPNYTLDPSVTGQPNFNGDSISHLCNILSTYRDIRQEGFCEGEFKVIRMWEVRDFCTEELLKFNQKIMVFDTTPPVLDCPDTMDISTDEHSCQALFTIPDIGAYDSCSHDNLTIIVSVSTHPGIFTPLDQIHLDTGVHVLSYTVYDDCGNAATCDVVVIVKDLVDPNIACVILEIPLGLNPLSTVSIHDLGLIVSDNCGVDSIAWRRLVNNCGLPNDTIFKDTLTFCCADVGQTIWVEYLVIDGSGNRNICMDSVIITPPINTCVIMAPPDTTIICNSATDTMALGEATVSNCIPNPIISFSDSTSGGRCTSTIFRTWSTFDVCGDVLSNVQIITIIDTIAPVIVPPNDTTISCDAMDDLMSSVSATDNCTPSDSISITSTIIPGGFVDGILIRWFARDYCGNVDISDQEVTVVDITPPSITCPIDIMISTDSDICAATVNIPIPVPTDNCGIMSLVNDYTMTNDASGVYPLGTTTVEYIVTDIGGNMDTCTFTVTVIDSVAPILFDLQDTTVNCDVDLSVLSIFGVATATDNCTNADSIVITTDSISDIDNACGTGTITRIIIATDLAGNMDTITQIITVEPTGTFTLANIVCPEDTIIVNDCNAGTSPAALNSFVTLIDTAGLCCFNGVDVEFEDTAIDDPNFCMAIRRVWTITDVCQNIASPGSGDFTCTQLILIDDPTGPSFTFAPSFTTTLAEGVCEIFLGLPSATATGCGAITITNDSPFANSNGADIDGTYPIGETIVTFTATDICGNQSQVQRTITINGQGEFGIVCGKAIVNIQANGQVTVSPISFVTEVINVCPPGSQVILSFSEDINDITRTFTCAQIGLMALTIFATDINGNKVSCDDAEADVNDGGGFCNGIMVNLGGQLKTAMKGQVLPFVEVRVDESEEILELSDEQGHYVFEQIEAFGEVEIMPSRDGYFYNGLNTLDMIWMQRHILNLQTFDNPYQYIAADINRDKVINVLDLLALQNAVLYQQTHIDENSSWLFVTEDYKFLNPSNPLIENYPQSHIIPEAIDDHMDNNFVAIKVGDIDETADLGLDPVNIRSKNFIEFEYKLDEYKEDQLIIFNKEGLLLDGLQLFISVDRPLDKEIIDVSLIGLNDNQSVLKYEIIDEFTLGIMLGLSIANEYQPGQGILSINGISTEDNDLIISVVSTRSQAYVNGRTHEIRLKQQKEKLSTMTVRQNYPNPFNSETIVSFWMPDNDDVSMTIYDMTGKTIYARTKKALKGENRMVISADQLNQKGLLYYELSSSMAKDVKMMLLQE